ncbi:MAG: Calx-beta domain-containing protein, partial [Pyrinomonadaceae bacterium]
ATFTVTLSAPALATDVTFDIATQDNTATASNNDYVVRTLTNQTIPAGQQTYVFTVTLNGDTAVEPNETFFVNVTNVNGATLADGQGLGTIQNDDLPTLSIDDFPASEGDSGTKTFTFTVGLSAPASTGGVKFDIATADGTAHDGTPADEDNDYTARSLTGQTIPEGSQSSTFSVTVNGDPIIESNETFFVNVTTVSGATVVDGQGLGTIQNDDSPTLSINDFSSFEGNSGTTTFRFTVSSSLPAPEGGITFDIATQDSTASFANGDYLARSFTGQTIPAGLTTYTFDVPVNGDRIVEPDETFFVNLANVSGANVSDGQGQGTIQNDDVPLLVITQVYGGGGNTNAAYQNDFIEIFNRGNTTIDLSITPYSVQYAAATSAFGTNKTDINSGVIPPGRYFLIKGASSGAVGLVLPTPDATGTINLAATAGKVALVAGTTALNGVTCPGDDGASPFNPNVAVIADFLGYGNAANCYEGSAPLSVSGTNSNVRSLIRTAACTDTNNNSKDFSNPTTAPTARNSATASAACP